MSMLRMSEDGFVRVRDISAHMIGYGKGKAGSEKVLTVVLSSGENVKVWESLAIAPLETLSREIVAAVDMWDEKIQNPVKFLQPVGDAGLFKAPERGAKFIPEKCKWLHDGGCDLSEETVLCAKENCLKDSVDWS